MPYSNARIVTSWHLLENFAQSRGCDFCQQRRILVPLSKSPSPMSQCILLHMASNVLSTKGSFSKRTWFPTKQWTQQHSSTTVCLREKQQFYVLWSSSCKYGIKVCTTHFEKDMISHEAMDSTTLVHRMFTWEATILCSVVFILQVWHQSTYDAHTKWDLKLDLQMFGSSISEGYEPQNLQTKTATFADVASEDLKVLKYSAQVQKILDYLYQGWQGVVFARSGFWV